MSFGELTVARAISRVRARNVVLRAVLTPTLEQAERRSLELRDSVPLSPLHGVPYVLKDVWETAGIRTTSGSWRHRERVPPKSSSVYEALQQCGAVLIGKSNLSDLALSPEADNHLLGATCNPHNFSRTSGGSTGGGAVAIADGMAAFDWGSDFGGSIRLPSAFCGTVGLRLSCASWPSHEHVPVVPASLARLNGMGPMGRTVRDCKTLLETLAPKLCIGTPRVFKSRGVVLYGPRDRFSAGKWPSFVRDADTLFRGMNVPVREDQALPSPMDVDGLYNHLLSSHFDDMLGTGEISVLEGLPAALSAVALGRFSNSRQLHRNTAQALLVLYVGHYTVWRNRARALERLDALQRAVERLWNDGLLMCAPTTTYPAPRHGRVLWTLGIMAFTKLGNLLDATCIAVPFGHFDNGMPRSLQILGPPGSEAAVLALAEQIHVNSA